MTTAHVIVPEEIKQTIGVEPIQMDDFFSYLLEYYSKWVEIEELENQEMILSSKVDKNISNLLKQIANENNTNR